MDPVSAFGLVSGGLQVVQIITQTVAGLATLRGKFNSADLTIRSLIGELTTIKSAITQLEDWARYNACEAPEHNEYDEGLNVALDGCRAVMEVLSEDISSLTKSAAGEGSVGFRTRVRVVWNDEAMKDHQERLRAQVLALQLLLQACQCRTSSEQVELLRKTESRQIIQKVADDTATLRTSSSYAVSRADSSSLSNHQSQAGDTTFDFDDAVVSSPVYRRAPRYSRQESEQPLPVHNSRRSKSTDEGYASGVTAASNLPPSPESPIQQMGGFSMALRPQDSVFPEHGRSKSVAFSPSSRSSRKNGVWRARSDSASSSASSGSKREVIWSALRRLSTSSRVNLAVSPRNSTAARRERQERKGFSISIDLASTEGAAAPHIVKIAQSGSMVDVERLIECGHDIEARHFYSGRTALLVAAHCGNGEVVDLLIQHNARLNVVDGMGYTALHLAASRGHCEVVGLLVAEDLDIETRNKFGNTALWVAAYNGQFAATQLLIANHAKVNTRSPSQMTALHAAAKQGDDQIVELLIDNGADFEARDGSMMTALHYACEEGHPHVVEFLLKKKANIDAPGRDRRTPLICAAATGRFQAVQQLLRSKPSDRATDDASMTALHWAAFNGHVEIVDLLSKRKGSLLMTNKAGRTPLHLAVMGNQFVVVELLLRRNSQLETRCRSGLAAFHYACIANSLEIMRLLLITGSDIEAQVELDGDQRRPIHIAAASGSTSSIDLLIDKGASLEARDAMRDRALCVACRYGHAAAAQKLLSRGSPFYLGFGTGPHEDSPLCLAAMGGHSPVISLLVQHGASILQRNEVGWRPVHYAAYYGHLGSLRLLLAMNPSDPRTGLGADPTVERVGFAPHVSAERRREVTNLLGQAPQLRMEGVSPGFPFGAAPSALTSGGLQPPPPSPFERTSRRVPDPIWVQELPGTLEQGLPSSRSVTPERMHRYANDNLVDAGRPANTDLAMELNGRIRQLAEIPMRQDAQSGRAEAQRPTEGGPGSGTVPSAPGESTVDPEATDAMAHTFPPSIATTPPRESSDSESLSSVHTAPEEWPVQDGVYGLLV